MFRFACEVEVCDMTPSLVSDQVHVTSLMTDYMTVNATPCCPALPLHAPDQDISSAANLVQPGLSVFYGLMVSPYRLTLLQNHFSAASPVLSRERQCTFVVDLHSEFRDT